MSVLTVSQLNKYVAFKINSDIKLKSVMVEGEISNFNNHYKSGHFYFTLKDSNSCIKAVMFATYASKLKFEPYDGMNVILSGNVEVFERDGVYQIYVTAMQPSGIGGLYLAVEQKKKKLMEKGYFDESFKKPLSLFPEKIGVVTSKSGAVLHDIINVLTRRYPACMVTLYSSVVQGEYAVSSLCDNLKIADNDGNDVIIIGRGGGSLEDLMAFNNENLAKVVFECNTPVISAVGHEVDTTICDLVADLRAPTPSAAAELAVPEINEIRNYLESIDSHINQTIKIKVHNVSDRLDLIDVKLNSLSPNKAIESYINSLNFYKDQLDNKINSKISECNNSLNEKISILETLNPLSVLSRGYSLVYKCDNNKVVRSADELKTDESVKIQFRNSHCLAIIKEKDVDNDY